MTGGVVSESFRVYSGTRDPRITQIGVKLDSRNVQESRTLEDVETTYTNLRDKLASVLDHVVEFRKSS